MGGLAIGVLSLLMSGCQDPGDPAAGRAHAQAEEAEQQDSRALACFTSADDRTTLRRDQAQFLCWGARSTGPVDCFERGQAETTLSRQALIHLCRCAQGTTPVSCYERYKHEVQLSDPRIVEWCRPIVVRSLTASCIPIRDL